MELLVHTFERPNEGGGGYQPGDIIIVKPDGWPWSKLERTTFFVVRLPDSAFTALEWNLMSRPQDGMEDDDAVPGEQRKVQLRQRRFFLSLDHLTKTRRRALLQTKIEKPILDADFAKAHVVDKEKLAPRFLKPVEPRYYREAADLG